jgi:hypothetical protein
MPPSRFGCRYLVRHTEEPTLRQPGPWLRVPWESPRRVALRQQAYRLSSGRLPTVTDTVCSVPPRRARQRRLPAPLCPSGGRARRGRGQRVGLVKLASESTQSLTVDKQGEHCNALTCAFEPEVGFEPTTFRLRVEEPSSSRCRPDPFWLLTSAGSSVECVPDLPSYGRRNDQENDQADPRGTHPDHDCLPIPIGRQQLHRTLNHCGRRLIIDQGPPDRKRMPAKQVPA